jgi:hypothetical protein
MAVPVLWALGCTWVPLDPQAEAIRVRAPGDISGCERIGKTGTRVAARVGPFARGESKIRQELETLARNEAAEMGGNAVAPLNEATGGEQDFGIYRCP